MKKTKLIAGILGAGLAAKTAYDTVRVLKIPMMPALPIEDGKVISQIGLAKLFVYFNDEKVIPKGVELNDEFILAELSEAFEYINCKYDCSDFYGHMLFRFYKEYEDRLSDDVKEEIKKVFLGFKYWMDMPDDESLCFFSENHTVLYGALEYLVGQEWGSDVFSNSGLTGFDHKVRGHARLMDWFDQRYRFGFFEWYSGNYWNEDLGTLMQLVSFAKDEEIVKNAKNVADLMWFEILTHSPQGRFITVSSRQYGDNKMNSDIGNRIQMAINFALTGEDNYEPYAHTSMCLHDSCLMICIMCAMRNKDYVVPQLFKKIAFDKSEQIIKTSNGLNPSEYADLDLIGQSDYQMMAQLSNEIFCNKGFAQNTFEYHRRNETFASKFSDPMKFADIYPVRKLKLLPKMCDMLGKNFAPEGSALTRDNVYTYRKNDYMLATACNCNVDHCGNQHHVNHANISNEVNVFSHYPASLTRLAGSPGYWGGYRRMPMAAQNEAVSITMYRIDPKQRMIENKPIDMTHVLFPTEKFDEYSLDGTYAFGRKGKTFIAVVCNEPMVFKPYERAAAMALVTHDQSSVVHDSFAEGPEEYMLKESFDLCAIGGDYHTYVMELSDASNETYEKFKERILNNTFKQIGDKVQYISGGKKFDLAYTGEFAINGKVQDLEFDRFESAYCNAKRYAEEFVITFEDETLTIPLQKL